MSILKRIFCKHEWEWECNIPGPARMYNGWKCTQYVCPKCGARKLYKEYIHKKIDWEYLENDIKSMFR